MPHTLAVTVHVDLDLKEVELAVSGCLTAETHTALLPLIAQARGLTPSPRITVDLLGTGHIDHDGLQPLQQLTRLDPDSGGSPVSYRVPDPLPACTRTVKAMPTSWTGTGSAVDDPIAGSPLALVRGGDELRSGVATEAPAPAPASPAPLAPAPEPPAREAPAPEPAHPGPRTRRDEILLGAAQMFAEHGYHGASLRDISSRIGISHPGLMHHFASKTVLLDAVIDRLEAHAQQALDGVEEMCADPESMMRALAGHWHPGSLSIQLLSTLGAESVSGDHPGRFRMARLRRVHEHVLEQCFTELARQHRLRRGLDPAFAGRALFGLVLNLAVREKTVRTMQGSRHDDAPIEELSRLVRSFLEPDGPR